MANLVEVRVPDIGDFKEVEVIELLVKPGDTIAAEQSLVTVESDKASMEIPSSASGVVRELKVKLGDKVSEGSLLLMIDGSAPAASAAAAAPAASAAPTPAVAAAPGPAVGKAAAAAPSAPDASTTALPAAPAGSEPAPDVPPSGDYSVEMGARPGATDPSAGILATHASPSVRKVAREFGVDLRQVRGSGPKGRITPEDVRAFVRDALQVAAGTRGGAAAVAAGVAPAGFGNLPPWPVVDFAKFGPVERVELSRIRRISGPVLHRNWVSIPHVTNHEDADVTELEAFRVQLNTEGEKSGTKVTMLAFLIRACVAALQKFPDFNGSLDAGGDAIVRKGYYHIGFAADTPNGLVVPVVRDADRKGVLELARETSSLAAKAREGKLSPAEMQGGTFSISSLGGIGGTYFTPIINAPEVAILGVCRAATRPVWDGGKFAPRLILPLSLSWDHRVVDGAGAARFNAHVARLLADFRRVLL